MPQYRRSPHAVIGHAANPENNANQPLVGGHGPNVMMSPKPPMMVSSAQPHATTQPRMRTSCGMRCRRPVDEALIYVMMRRSYGSDSKQRGKSGLVCICRIPQIQIELIVIPAHLSLLV